jgi:hypothetical protein
MCLLSNTIKISALSWVKVEQVFLKPIINNLRFLIRFHSCDTNPLCM